MQDQTVPALIAGFGANSRECAAIIRACNQKGGTEHYRLLGFVGDDLSDIGTHGDTEVVCTDETLYSYIRDYPKTAIFIPIGTPSVKRQLYQKYSALPNVGFPALVHPSAVFLDFESVSFGQGCIVSAGAVISICVALNNFVYVNYGATVGHDTRIGAFSQINPNCTISGNVRIGRGVTVGAGASIRQGIRMGDGSVLGMGSCLVKNAEPGSVMITKAPLMDLRKNQL